jgi:hypothetical protein
MSSLKMTFSLASLVLLIALVFAPVSVMAHAPVSDGVADNPSDTMDHPDGLTTLATHMHPSVSIGGTEDDANPNVDGFQVVGGTTDASREVTFDVVVTVDELVQQEDDNQPIDAGTFVIATGDPLGSGFVVTVYNDKDAQAGTGELGTFEQADAAKPREWTGTVTVTVSSVATGDGAEDKDVAAAIKAGLNVDVVMLADTIESSRIRGPYEDQSNLKTTATFTIISSVVDKDPVKWHLK